MVPQDYIRDGKNKLIGSVTSGFSDESSVARDEDGELLGRTSDRFNTTQGWARKADISQYIRCGAAVRQKEIEGTWVRSLRSVPSVLLDFGRGRMCISARRPQDGFVEIPIPRYHVSFQEAVLTLLGQGSDSPGCPARFAGE